VSARITELCRWKMYRLRFGSYIYNFIYPQNRQTVCRIPWSHGAKGLYVWNKKCIIKYIPLNIGYMLTLYQSNCRWFHFLFTIQNPPRIYLLFFLYLRVI